YLCSFPTRRSSDLVAVVLLIPLIMLPKLVAPEVLLILHIIRSATTPSKSTVKVALLLGQNLGNPLLLMITGLRSTSVISNSTTSDSHITPFLTACLTTRTVAGDPVIRTSTFAPVLSPITSPLITLHTYT